MSKVGELLEYHMKVQKIVYKYIDKSEITGKEETIYMIRSIKGTNQSYNVIKQNERWYCDCPSFKFKTGTDKDGYCKHILLVVFMLDNKIEIEVV